MDNLASRIANLSPAKRALLEQKLQQKNGLKVEQRSLIPRRSHLNSAPLTLAQQRLWLLNQLDPDSPFYNIKWALRLKGILDYNTLKQALNTIVTRHESLRTTFVVQDGTPIQQISQEWTLDLPLIDLTVHAGSAQEAILNDILNHEVDRPFDLTSDLMLRAVLIRLSEQEHVFLIIVHHIVTDGWSIEVLARELSTLYTAYSNDQPSPLAELPIQYGDFAEWQQAQLTEEVLERQLSYWRQQLAAPPVLELPTDFARSPIQTFNGQTRYVYFNSELTQPLKQLSQSSGTTLFVTLLTAFATLLSRYSGQDDIIIGSPFANRNYREIEPLVGLFLTTLPLRIDLSGSPTFWDLLQRSKQVALDAYAHQDVPFEQLTEELQPNRDPSQSPWFQVMFALQNFPKHDLNFPTVVAESLPVKSLSTKFDLAIFATETNGELELELTYNTDLFTDATIERLLGHFQTLLSAIATHPDQSISTLPLLTPAEQQQLQDWANYTTDFPAYPSIHHLFEIQAAQTPEAIAVIGQGQQLTYRELNERANQLAHHLRSLGIQPDSLVGLSLERSPNLLVGLLGILKAGGAYVPIDPTYPPERQAYLISDANPALVLTQQQFTVALSEFDVPLLALDTDWSAIAQHPATNPEPVTTPDHLAYVIYTSGSTGQPKGVLIPHHALLNFTQAAIDEYQISGGDRVLQFASISFDAAAEEIYPCLCRGGTLILRSDEVLGSAATLFRHCEEQNISVLDLPTAYWHQLAAEVAISSLPLPAALRLVIIGGEQAIPTRLHQWQSWAVAQAQHAHRLPPQLVNTYGPTEATVVATIYRVPSELSVEVNSIPIGQSLSNVSTYVLDQSLQLLPIGVPGELHIGGAGLARGYLNRPDLTEQRFIPHPLSPDTRLYKTGDLVRYRPDGLLEFLGRVDDQVKIRGFRIELGEIETTLMRHPLIQTTVVSVDEDEQGEKSLVAYVVSPPGQSLTLPDLRRHLRETLPEYMIPATFVLLERIPLTPTGKVDRRSLPSLNGVRLSVTSQIVPPGTPIEATLVEFWTDLLNVETLSIYDNFFELGGHSLSAARLVARIAQTFDIELPMRTVFQSPSIAELAERIETILWTHQQPLSSDSDNDFEEGEL